MVDLEAAAKSPSKLRQLHLLGEIYRLSEEWNRRQVPTDGLYNEGHLWGVDVSALRSDFTALMAAGWIYFEASSAGVDEVLITPEGVDVALEYQAKRSNPRQRATALKTALLNWLYDQHLAGEEPKDFASFKAVHEGNYLGLAYDDDEITRGAKWLRDKGYIEAWTPITGKVMSPRITSSGVDFVELTEAAGPPAKPEAMTVNNFNIRDSHSMNFAVGSPGAVQSNSLTAEQVYRVRKVGNLLRDVKPALGLPDERQEEADKVIAELEWEAASPEPHRGKLKALLYKVLDVVATGTAESAVEVVSSMAQTAIEGLG